MNSSARHLIPNVLSSLANLEDLSLHDQGLFLLSRLALLFPRSKTFWGIGLLLRKGDRLDPNWLAPGLPRYELRRAIYLLLDHPWREIVHNGYLAETPPGSGWYEITDEGWAAVESNTVEVDIDDHIAKIFP